MPYAHQLNAHFSCAIPILLLLLFLWQETWLLNSECLQLLVAILHVLPIGFQTEEDASKVWQRRFQDQTSVDLPQQYFILQYFIWTEICHVEIIWNHYVFVTLVPGSEICLCQNACGALGDALEVWSDHPAADSPADRRHDQAGHKAAKTCKNTCNWVHGLRDVARSWVMLSEFVWDILWYWWYHLHTYIYIYVCVCACVIS